MSEEIESRRMTDMEILMDEFQPVLAEMVEMSHRMHLIDQLAKILCPIETQTHKQIIEILGMRAADSRAILRTKREALICAVLDRKLRNGQLDSLYSSEPIAFEREVRLPCGNADRIIRHADETLTVVEVKAAGSRRDHAQGIGQILLYTAAVRAIRDAKDVRGMLVVGGKPDEWIESACKQAGIEYVVITNYETELEVRLAQAWMQGRELCGRA